MQQGQKFQETTVSFNHTSTIRYNSFYTTGAQDPGYNVSFYWYFDALGATDLFHSVFICSLFIILYV